MDEMPEKSKRNETYQQTTERILELHGQAAIAQNEEDLQLDY